MSDYYGLINLKNKTANVLVRHGTKRFNFRLNLPVEDLSFRIVPNATGFTPYLAFLSSSGHDLSVLLFFSYSTLCFVSRFSTVLAGCLEDPFSRGRETFGPSVSCY